MSRKPGRRDILSPSEFTLHLGRIVKIVGAWHGLLRDYKVLHDRAFDPRVGADGLAIAKGVDDYVPDAADWSSPDPNTGEPRLTRQELARRHAASISRRVLHVLKELESIEADLGKSFVQPPLANKAMVTEADFQASLEKRRSGEGIWPKV